MIYFVYILLEDFNMPITVTQTRNTQNQNQNRQPSTAKIVSGVIDVAATLAKWGIDGTCYIINCGIDLSKDLLGSAKNLAEEFSGSKAGINVGESMLKHATKAAKTGVDKTGNFATSAVAYLAKAAKSRL